MLHVGLLSHSPHLSGAERMLLNLAIGLASTGRVRPLLCIPAPEMGVLMGLAQKHRIPCQEIPSASWYLLQNAESLHTFWSRTMCQARDYCDVLKRHALDVVVVNTLTSLPGALAAMKLGIPYVSWVHGIVDASLLGQPSPLARICENLTLRGAAHVVTCSEWTARHFRHRTLPSRITSILNWTNVPPPPVDEQRDRQRFVCLSSLEKHKGLDVAIRAVGKLAAGGRKCLLDLYGCGSDQEHFMRIIRKERLQRVIRLLGRTTDVGRVYETALATLFPSRVEPFGMLAIESMARETPVIAARVGGLPEIIDHAKDGLLFESGNVEQLAEHMAALLDNPQEAKRLGKAGYRKVRAEFNGDVSLRRFESILQDATAQAASNPDMLLVTDLLDSVVNAVPPGTSPRACAVPGEALGIALSDVGGSPPTASEQRDTPSIRDGQIKRLIGEPKSFLTLRKRLTYEIIPGQPKWAGIDVLLGTHQHRASGRLVLRVHGSSGTVLREVANDLGGARDNDWMSFRFDPITRSNGQPLAVSFSLVGAKPGTRVSIYESNRPESRIRRAIRRAGLLLAGNTLYCRLWYLS
jgi:glycosyltransferase involved in cell wall biosynthesis